MRVVLASLSDYGGVAASRRRTGPLRDVGVPHPLRANGFSMAVFRLALHLARLILVASVALPIARPILVASSAWLGFINTASNQLQRPIFRRLS